MLQTNLSWSGGGVRSPAQAALPSLVLSGKRLLLVGVDVDALSRMLARWRLDVVVAGSAQAALESMVSVAGVFDFLLVDGALPDMCATDLVSRLAEPGYAPIRPGLAILLAPQVAVALPAYAQLLTYPITDQALLASLLRPPLTEVVALAAAEPRLAILLVEGCRLHEQLAFRLLTSLGHQLVVAQNGEEAMQVFDGMRFDLVLMDSQLAVQDGWQTVQQIRQMELAAQRKRVPIVLMSATGQAADPARWQAAGVDGVLDRPLQPEQFQTLLARVLAVEPAAELAAIQALRVASPVLRLQQALDRFGGDKALLVEIIDAFLRDFPEQLAAMVDGLANGDQQRIRIAAHGLKGTSSLLSALILPKLACLMEETAKAGDLVAVAMILPVLREALQEFEAALRAALVDIDGALAACRA